MINAFDTQTNRRKNYRFVLELPLQIKNGECSFETKTSNISRSGVFCKIDRFLPVKTEITVTMRLSFLTAGRKVRKTIHCPAKVVHIIPPQEQPEQVSYETGIEFSKIREVDKDFLLLYIRQKNLKEAKELKKMYLKLKEMAGRLVEFEESHPTAGHFLKVIDRAISELDSAAHILDYEINELKDLE